MERKRPVNTYELAEITALLSQRSLADQLHIDASQPPLHTTYIRDRDNRIHAAISHTSIRTNLADAPHYAAYTANAHGDMITRIGNTPAQALANLLNDTA